MRTRSISSILLLTAFGRGVESHGYLKSPRSRNYIAWQDGVWSGGSSTSYPKEDCPHCANIGGTAGQCGVIGSRNYDENLNVFGKPMAAKPQAQYAQGQVIDIDVVLTAHHMGHFEFSACPIAEGGVASGDCFKQYPLEFVADPLYGAPKDSNYPYRAYIATPGRARSDNTGLAGTFYRFSMKLPDNLSGDIVLLQWHYYTANSCVYPGYSSYPYPSDWGTFQTGTGICSNIPSDGRGLPEQFWNCAEISIYAGPIAPSTPAPVPAPSVPTPTAPTTYPPSPNSPTGGSPASGSDNASYCADGKVGNGRCSDSSLCCSRSGFCGTGEPFCGASPQPTAAPQPTASPRSPSPTKAAAPAGVTPIPLPEYATGNCSGIENVMSVNLGYYQSWAIYRDVNCNPVTPDDIDVKSNAYTHLVYTFASISSDFKVEPWDGNPYAEVPQYLAFNALKDVYPGLKTMIAVGGWTFNDPGNTQTRFSDAASTESNRATFAASCVEFCRAYNFDGVDLDWEYPADNGRGGTSADKTNYGLLVQAIRAAFDAAPEDLELSVATAVASSRIDEGFDLPALAQGVDFFNLMTYDIHGVWDSSKQIGANSDMPYIFSAVQYFLDAGISPSKLVLGLAAYGHTFTLADTTCATVGCTFSSAAYGGCAGADGFMPYFSIDEYVRGGNYNSLKFNADTGTMELVIDGSTFISYDNPDTFEIKNDFASKSCFRGIMWWAVDMKERPILLGSNPPPSPSPVLSSPAGQPSATTSDWKTWVVSTDLRCGTSELDARGNCRPTCTSSEDCTVSGHKCWRVHENYCGSKPPLQEECDESSPFSTGLRCGPTEALARETCGSPCTSVFDCESDAGEYCFALNPNFCGGCGSSNARTLRGGN